MFFSQLQVLNLCEAVQIDDLAVSFIADNCPSLQTLRLEWALKPSDKSFEELFLKCKRLKKGYFSGIKSITDKCLYAALRHWEEMRQPSALNSLKKLDFQSCNFVADAFLEKVKRNFPRIKILNYYS